MMVEMIWLMMVNNNTGWWLSHPSKKYEFVNGKDYPIYIDILWKIKHGANHQPDSSTRPTLFILILANTHVSSNIGLQTTTMCICPKHTEMKL